MKKNARILYITGIVIVVLFLLGNSGFRTMIRRYWEINKLESEIEQKKKKNILLKKEVRYLEDDTIYIERIARRELSLILPGEVEYRFKD